MTLHDIKQVVSDTADKLTDGLWSQAGVHRDGESVNVVDALFAISRAIGSHGHAVTTLARAIERLAAKP
jgi:hypothetical protein